MQVMWSDFNGAKETIGERYGQEWAELEHTLKAMPLHLKASDQAGIQGRPIFDAVGTNEFIRDALLVKGWAHKIPIPPDWAFLGTDVDFGKRGIILEVQFSNYPFLLNNVLRSELFFKSQAPLAGAPMDVCIIVSKAKMFPASNSTLYYEQGIGQLRALSEKNVFDVPIRLVGLYEVIGAPVQLKWTEYSSSRHSRTVERRTEAEGTIVPGRGPKSRCSVRRNEP